MTFRLPFKIFRAVSLSRPASPNIFLTQNKIRHEFQSNNSTFVDANNNTKILQLTSRYNVRQNISSLPHFLPYYSFQHRYKSFNLENKKKVRKQHKCNEKKCERKLVFRDTSREECVQCIQKVPDKCPKLHRLKPEYDESKLKWKHENCEVESCPSALRMDNIKGLQIVRKKLPKLIKNKCEICRPQVPTKAPKLTRPERHYDPSKLEQDRGCNKNLCNIVSQRLDDIRGYKVTQKELPTLQALKDCKFCAVTVPTKAPKIQRLKKRYDPSKLEQDRLCNPNVCDIIPPRMDDVVGLKIKSKELPKLLSKDNCVKCVPYYPKHAPKLRRPKKKYDPSKMKWNHTSCKDQCEENPPRIDDIRGYKIVEKTLPKLKTDCIKCTQKVPTKLPKLNPPKKQYDDSKLKWTHNNCSKILCHDCPMRMDDIMKYTVKRKKLPKLKLSQECTFCRDVVPTTAPKLCRPEKLYDESKMKYAHIDCTVGCENHPLRMDDIKGYKVKSKKLKNILLTDDCKLCMQVVPTKAPKLIRPKQIYNPKTLEQDRSCNNNLCNINPKRMDDIVGLKIERKELPHLQLNDCTKCVTPVPKFAPKLKAPKRKYDPYTMKWNHLHCKDICATNPPRMDDIVGYKVTPKKLPKMTTLHDCNKCVTHVPKYAPMLKRPKKRYDDSLLEQPRAKCIDLCDLDPPRMDDVRCWKPEKKILPSFCTKTQTRCYSTFLNPLKRVTYPIYKTKNYAELRQKAHTYGKRYKSNSTKCPKVPNCPKCPKFKLKYCKPCAREICEEYKQKPCKKTEAPYESYGDRFDGFWEEDPTECTNWNEVLLQPQKQLSGHFYKLKPPPPPWRHIDPSLQRNCQSKVPEPEPDPPDAKWKYCGKQFKMEHCAKRDREYCPDYDRGPPCKKLEAPYKSFSDRDPQFPEVEMTECDRAEKYYKDQMVNYAGSDDPYVTKESKAKKHKSPATESCKAVKKPLTKTKCPGNRGKKCKPKKCDKKSKACKSKKCDKKSIVCKSKKSDKEVKICKSKQNDKEAIECKSKKSKKRVCKSKKNDKEVLECKSKKSEKEAVVCKSGSEKELVCVCKPVSNATAYKISKQQKGEKKCGDKKETIKTIICPTKECGKKMLCVCKPTSKSSVKCKPKKVSSKSKCANYKCRKSSNTTGCCGLNLSDVRQQESSCKEKLKPPSSVDPPARQTIWDKICAYFRARPGCPGPNDWKQMELEDKAKKAAAAAGLEIIPPKCTYVTVNKKKCANKMMGKKKEPICRRKSLPKISPCCSKRKKAVCPSKTKKQKKCSKNKRPCCLKPKKKVSSCKKPTCNKLPKKCVTQKKEKTEDDAQKCCKNSSGIKQVGSKCKLKNKKNYATYVAKSNYFSTYSRIFSLCKKSQKKNKRVLTNPRKENTNENSANYSKNTNINSFTHPYLRLNNNYVGKMFKLKLTKIGIRNALLKRNTEEEPFTICHICKVIPRHQTACNNTNIDIKNIKFKSNSESRTNM